MPEVGDLEWLASQECFQHLRCLPVCVRGRCGCGERRWAAVETVKPLLGRWAQDGQSRAQRVAARLLATLTALPIHCAVLQVKNPDKGPELRTGHSVVVTGLPNNPKAVVIGGCTSSALVNDVWSLKLGAESLEWERPKIGQPDSAPSPRWRHTATLLRKSSPSAAHRSARSL